MVVLGLISSRSLLLSESAITNSSSRRESYLKAAQRLKFPKKRWICGILAFLFYNFTARHYTNIGNASNMAPKGFTTITVGPSLVNMPKRAWQGLMYTLDTKYSRSFDLEIFKVSKLQNTINLSRQTSRLNLAKGLVLALGIMRSFEATFDNMTSSLLPNSYNKRFQGY